MTLPLRVALQGGGAKIVTLMAAAEVLEDLAKNDEIEITELAGTSAGSIVACMLAAKISIPEFRVRTREAGKELIKHFGKLPRTPVLLYRAYRGQPFFSEDRVREFLCQVFKGVENFSDLGIPTSIIVSNMRHREKSVYSSVGSNERLEDVAMNSSALPIAFRSFKHSDLKVDGGIVSNFPAEELMRENDKDHSLLGFSFESMRESGPKNIIEYMEALLSTSIESSVQSNARRIEEIGGMVCQLPVQHRTLDFAGALEALEDGPYSQTKDVARERIKPLLHVLSQRGRAQRRNRGTPIDVKLARIHDSLKQEYPYRATKASVLVEAHCLAKKSSSAVERSDIVVQTVSFRPIANRGSIFTLRVGLAIGDNPPVSHDRDDVRVLDEQGIELGATTSFIKVGEAYYAVLILDEPKLLQNGETIRVVQRTEQVGAMRKLVTDRREWMRTKNVQDYSMDVEDFVLSAPRKGYESMSMSDLLHNITTHSEVALRKNLDEMRSSWCSGRKMTDQELSEYKGQFPPSGFTLFGWRAENVAPGQYCGAYVTC